MQKRIFDILPDGRTVHEYTLENDRTAVSILDFGGIIRKWMVGDKDMVCGYDNLADYLDDGGSYQGALIGRVGNRIAGARFTLNGKTYLLAKNNGQNHLHGGKEGFNRKIWNVDMATDDTLALSCFSPDGEEGYPANLKVKVVYRLWEDTLLLDYWAESDGDTPINLTNHTYFNMNGYDGGDILSHTLTIYGDRYTEVDDSLIPTGNTPAVLGTAFDFTTPHPIGERLGEKLTGYDHNYHLAPTKSETVGGIHLPLVATVSGKVATMDVFTTKPCMQFYTGNFLGGAPDFKGGVARFPRHAFCMETQYEPDSVNRGCGILKAGEEYHYITAYRIRPF